MAGITQGVVDGPGARFRTVPETPVVPLHPAIRSMLDAEVPGPPLRRCLLPELRALREAMMLRRPRRNEPVAGVENTTVPGPAGGIPVRIYRPSGGTGPYPIVAYFHGGGWVMGTLDTHDDVCRTLANRSSALVVSVGRAGAASAP